MPFGSWLRFCLLGVLVREMCKSGTNVRGLLSAHAAPPEKRIWCQNYCQQRPSLPSYNACLDKCVKAIVP